MNTLGQRLLRATVASLVGWATAAFTFGLTQLLSSPQLYGAKPSGFIQHLELYGSYTALGALFALLLIPVLAVLFSVWLPRRGPKSRRLLVAVAFLAAVPMAATGAVLAGSTRSESLDVLLPLVIVCWAAVLGGAVFDRWRPAA